MPARQAGAVGCRSFTKHPNTFHRPAYVHAFGFVVDLAPADDSPVGTATGVDKTDFDGGIAQVRLLLFQVKLVEANPQDSARVHERVLWHLDELVAVGLGT